MPNGVITHYTVYAIPLGFAEPSGRRRRQSEAIATPQTIQKVASYFIDLAEKKCSYHCCLLVGVPWLSDGWQHHTVGALHHLPVPSQRCKCEWRDGQ